MKHINLQKKKNLFVEVQFYEQKQLCGGVQ